MWLSSCSSTICWKDNIYSVIFEQAPQSETYFFSYKHDLIIITISRGCWEDWHMVDVHKTNVNIWIVTIIIRVSSKAQTGQMERCPHGVSIWERRASKRALGDGSNLKSHKLQYIIELQWREEYYHEESLDHKPKREQKGCRVERARQKRHKNKLKIRSQKKQRIECRVRLLVQRGNLVPNAGHVVRFCCHTLAWFGQNKSTSFKTLRGPHQYHCQDVTYLI